MCLSCRELVDADEVEYRPRSLKTRMLATVIWSSGPITCSCDQVSFSGGTIWHSPMVADSRHQPWVCFTAEDSECLVLRRDLVGDKRRRVLAEGSIRLVRAEVLCWQARDALDLQLERLS